MKTEDKTKVKEFDTVKTFRVIKEKMSLKMVNMSFEEIREYLSVKSKKLHQKL